MNPTKRARYWLARALARARRRGWTASAKRIRQAQDDLRPPVRITWPGVSAARDQSRLGGLPGDPGTPVPPPVTGWCLMLVRLCYGIAPRYPDAASAWVGAQKRHHQTSPTAIPRGYPVFWVGGSSKHGHVAISAGEGFCWSTDIKRPGRFDRVPIVEIHQRWGLQLVGWTEDLNGATVDAREENGQ